MNTFRLRSADTYCTKQELEKRIRTAISRNVKYIDLDLHEDLFLPLCLFTCKTLVDLTLNCGVPDPDTVYLPCLKKLSLINVVFFSDPALPTLLSGCPVLEELIMSKIVDSEMVWCNIISPTIKRLTIDFRSVVFGFANHRLEINAPALEYLQLTDTLSEHVGAQMLASLIEANIFLDYHHLEVRVGHSYFTSVLNFIDSLYNVKLLKLSSGKTFSAEVFADHISKSLVRFDNLIELELAADWLFLTKFLQIADNLKVLIICEVEENLKHWMEPKGVPTCLLSRLETVRICYKVGRTEGEFMIVGYILSTGKVLKRMEIYFQRGIGTHAKHDAIRRISLFHRGSKACELAFY